MDEIPDSKKTDEILDSIIDEMIDEILGMRMYSNMLISEDRLNRRENHGLNTRFKE